MGYLWLTTYLGLCQQRLINASLSQRLVIKPKLSRNAIAVLKARYLRRDTNRRIIETPQQMFLRVAKNIAQADKKYGGDPKKSSLIFYEMMAGLDFLPNSPTLFNAGLRLQQLSSCFVLPIDDSMDSIFRTLHHAALIHKSGGGTGYSFSRIRPKNQIVQSTRGLTTGPISFLRIYDAATQEIKQGGKRRGANMGILRCDHPDIEEFITCKSMESPIQNFNISVAATTKFMNAIKTNDSYRLVDPSTKKTLRKVNARRVLKRIAKNAWEAAEPGIVFIDRMNKSNPTPKIGSFESTNPCGEQPLLPYESCNLGSINLANMVDNGNIDWKKLGRTIHHAVHFLDNTIDMSKYPLPQIMMMTRGNRKIGLGVMGFAEMLVQLSIPYSSPDAVKRASQIMNFINIEAKKRSVELAKIRGVFPNFKGSIYDTGREEDLVRNATRTTIAPTGTISIIADCSSGIEPLFAVAYEHAVMGNGSLYKLNKHFVQIAKHRKFFSDKVVLKLMKKGRIQGMKGVPKDVQELFLCSSEIDALQHIRIQAAFQKHTDNAVSKTINLPHSATPADIEKIYMQAYALGCKGTTVYREGSYPNEVLTMGKK